MKCGICRIRRNDSFRCNNCGVCVLESREGAHACRSDSAHEECTICHEDTFLGGFTLPYYMKFWRHFNLANLAIFQNIAKLKCTKIKCR